MPITPDPATPECHGFSPEELRTLRAMFDALEVPPGEVEAWCLQTAYMIANPGAAFGDPPG